MELGKFYRVGRHIEDASAGVADKVTVVVAVEFIMGRPWAGVGELQQTFASKVLDDAIDRPSRQCLTLLTKPGHHFVDGVMAGKFGKSRKHPLPGSGGL